MSVPKGNIWQGLRKDCLDAIPSGCRTNLSNPISLAKWQQQGSYVVQAATRTSFQLIAPSDDFGSALLTDVECLLDHATEHQVSLWKHINSQEWTSPAWLAVTVYYWSFFLALAVSRLRGQSVWFLTPEVTKQFRTLGPSIVKPPGAGCFTVTCSPMINAIERNVILKKTDSRIHDELWRLLFKECAARLGNVAIKSSDSLEQRLFTAIIRSGKCLGNDWPSAFRNVVNYRHGFAYTSVRRSVSLKSLNYLRTTIAYDMAEIVERFENNVVQIRSAEAISKTPQIVFEILVDLTIIIHAIAKELHNELIERNKLDRRWRDRRNRFVLANGLKITDGVWPI